MVRKGAVVGVAIALVITLINDVVVRVVVVAFGVVDVVVMGIVVTGAVVFAVVKKSLSYSGISIGRLA